ncbi:S8 family serine peptidase, partial [Haloquadratum walsbyi]
DTGFDPDNQAIVSNVVDTQSFRDLQEPPEHGTSVAEIVARTAPNSQLYLASTSTGTDTEAAIDYLRRQDVDIIVHSAGFPAFEDNGNHILTDDINTVTESGTLFVNSAGNEARTHWEGDFRDTDSDNLHEWTQSNDDETNCVGGCNTDYSGDVTVYVRWSDEGIKSNYRPALSNPVKNEYIAVDSDGVFTTPTGTRYSQLRVEDISSQPVDLVVDHTSGPADDEIEVIIFNGPREIQRNVPASSIVAPADVPNALTVAAYEREPARLAPYSSRGPTDDGRNGIDVTGYTNIEITNGFYSGGVFGGTSAAAPYVGGVAALIKKSQSENQSPTEVIRILKSSSDDIRDVDIDVASGSGVVNATNAIDETKISPELAASASAVTIDPTDTNVTVVAFKVTNAGEESQQAVVNISESSVPQGLRLEGVSGADPTSPDQFAVITNQEQASVTFSDIPPDETVTATASVAPTDSATEATV